MIGDFLGDPDTFNKSVMYRFADMLDFKVSAFLPTGYFDLQLKVFSDYLLKLFFFSRIFRTYYNELITPFC